MADTQPIQPKAKLLVETLDTADKLRIMEEKRKKREKKQEEKDEK